MEMKKRIYHRLDISDTEWKLIKPHLTGNMEA